MTLRTIELRLTDAIGAAVALLIVAGGYLLLVREPWAQAGRLAEARASCAHTTRELADVHAEINRIQHDIDANTRKLASVGGGLPDAREIDRYLARVIALARANGIAIDTFLPLPLIDREDHRALHVNFVGRGTFAALHRMLRTIERELEYADVTNFSIAASPSGKEGTCQLNWSLRICTSREGSAAAAGPPPTPTPVSGARLHATSP